MKYSGRKCSSNMGWGVMSNQDVWRGRGNEQGEQRLTGLIKEG